MGNNMFCFQCEQTAGCGGCTGRAGVCGKQADTAQLQDQLTGRSSVLPVRQREMYRVLPLIKSLSRDYLQPSQM